MLASAVRASRPLPVKITIEVKPYEVFADRLFEKVLYNLITMRSIMESRSQGYASLQKRCRDNCCSAVRTTDGVEEGEKERIFEAGGGHNSGFGLFLAHEILAITGITIHETGISGEGARFEIMIPAGTFRSQGTGASACTSMGSRQASEH